MLAHLRKSDACHWLTANAQGPVSAIFMTTEDTTQGKLVFANAGYFRAREPHGEYRLTSSKVLDGKLFGGGKS